VLMGDGQATGVQELVENGDPTIADTEPVYPALQLQPAGMLAPLVLAGHGAGAQE
jgi:hypothetical protein